MEDREKRYNNRLFIIGGVFVVCFFGSFLLGVILFTRQRW